MINLNQSLIKCIYLILQLTKGPVTDIDIASQKINKIIQVSFHC
jgi:hypothetical protein